MTEQRGQDGETAESEVVLVRHAQGGDRAAFDRLVGLSRSPLMAIAFMRTGDREEAQDLVQEVLARAWQRLSALQDAEAFRPWLRAIMANACNSWQRHRRVLPLSVSLREGLGVPEPCPPPLAAVLERERQRELQRALAKLPDVNRIALLMHVWGGSSYHEIAAFTDVRVTTVEGRIFRAKRQLRRLLTDEGKAFLGESKAPLSLETRRRRSMTATDEKETPEATVSNGPADLEAARGLVAFSRRFSAMVDAGISLARCLLTLEELPAPYGAAAKDLRHELEQGQTLSEAMRRRPGLFSPCYYVLVRAGEVGGVLEEALARIADLLASEWRMAGRRPNSQEHVFLLLPSRQSIPEDWEDLTPYQQAMTRVLFLETFGKMLISGVPILQSMETLGALLPRRQAEQWVAARFAVRNGDPIVPALTEMAIFPQFALEMIAVGELVGSLDMTLHKTAEALEQELESGLLAGNSVGRDIPPFVRGAVGEAQTTNALLEMALRAGASEVMLEMPATAPKILQVRFLVGDVWRDMSVGDKGQMGDSTFRRLQMLAGVNPLVRTAEQCGVVPIHHGAGMNYEVEAVFRTSTEGETAHLKIGASIPQDSQGDL